MSSADFNGIKYPLKLMDNMQIKHNNILEYLHRFFGELSVNQICDYVLSPEFPIESDDEVIKTVNEAYKTMVVPTYNSISDRKINWNRLFRHNEYHRQNVIELVEAIVQPILFDEWLVNKQVYKVDRDFIDMLMNSGNPKFTKKQIRNLPCSSFYIDLVGIEEAKPICGIFIKIHVSDDYATIYGVALSDDLVVYSFESAAYTKNEDDVLEWHLKDNSVSEDVAFAGGQFADEKLALNKNKKSQAINMNFLRNISMLLTLYLATDEPDIKESEITKGTYKRPADRTKIKNKFSEVQAWDIGIKYGKELREYRRKVSKDFSDDAGTLKDGDGQVRTRKSPRPHFVCGHYKVVWTGKGRKTPVVRFITGFVRGGKQAADVVVHK